MRHCAQDDGFARSRDRFEEVVGFLEGGGSAGLTHAELEDRLDTEGRELLRLLFQDISTCVPTVRNPSTR